MELQNILLFAKGITDFQSIIFTVGLKGCFSCNYSDVGIWNISLLNKSEGHTLTQKTLVLDNILPKVTWASSMKFVFVLYLYSMQYRLILQDSKSYLTHPTAQVQPQLTSN